MEVFMPKSAASNVYSALMIVVTIFFTACSSSDENPTGSAGITSSEMVSKPDAISAALNQQGFEVVKQVIINGDVGILAKLPGSPKKRCIVLTGKPYSLGYQMGNLLPVGTYNMTKIYTENLLEEYAYVKKGTALFNTVKNMATALAKSAVAEDDAIPDYLLEEMKGVADGANAANPSNKQITADDVLVLNEGLDSLYSILFTARLPNTQGATQDILGCNGFVVSGGATVDGRVYHGRDFMLATGGVYQDEALMAVYIPDEGKPFVTIGAPGFVGQTAGLNSQGLSMGVDVVFGGATRKTPGIGCLLVIRDIIQNCSNLDEAIERMKSLNRGVSWVYVIADDDKSIRYTNGVVVEEGMAEDEKGKEFNGPDILPWYTQLSMMDLIEKLPEESPDRGVITRPQDWEYPSQFEGLEEFPPQIEKYDDLVIATNHYIHPRMVFTTFSPWMQFLQKNYWKTSRTLLRYSDLTARLTDEYGKIDFATARDLIDFMNPNREKESLKNGYEGWTRYEVRGEIQGHHDLFDNQDLIMECLYGYYNPDEPWVRVDLKPFVSIASQ
jgi:hypothetical protein